MRYLKEKSKKIFRTRSSFTQILKYFVFFLFTVTSRHSQLSMDSLASPLSSLTLIGQNSSGNGNNTDNNIDSAVGTFRNRGPRPAYSDANMQHSLGYLP